MGNIVNLVHPRLVEWRNWTTAAKEVWRPVLFGMRNEDDRRALLALFEDGDAPLQIFDTILSQLRDLIQSRHPANTFSAGELDSLAGEHLCGIPSDEYGVWVYYPWSRRLVHLLDEPEFAELRTNRNRYKITPAEQSELATKKIGIVGLSVGQSVAAVLALERSFGELRLADFDRIDLSNLNRIRAGVHSLGIAKVYVTAREIAEIDPFLKVTPFPNGINTNNLDAFLLQGGKLDAVVEECDSIDVKFLVRDRARFHCIPVVMDTSDRGMLDIERFDLEPHRPLFHGLAGDLRPEELRNLSTEQKVPHVLRILGPQSLSPRLRASLLEIGATISTWPQLGSCVSLGGAAAAGVVRRIVLDQGRQSGRFFVDPETAAEEPLSRVNVANSPVESAVLPAPRSAPADQLWNELVSAAILAPSGGNKQPWQWTASGNGRIDLFLDKTRSSGLIDFEYSGSYLALGCAAENLILAAHSYGFEISVDSFPSPADQRHAAAFRLLASSSRNGEPHHHDYLYSQIPSRYTQRNLGRHRSILPSDLEPLSAAVHSVAGAHVQWHTDRGPLQEIGRLIGAGDRIRMLNPIAHRQMFEEIRWTASDVAAHRDGIDIETLGLSASDRAGIDLCRDWSSLELLSAIDGGRNLEKISNRQINDAGAVGLITMDGSGSTDYFTAGRAVQRMWLTASKMGIAIHPMTALIYFFARLLRGGGEELTQAAVRELRSIRSRFEALFHANSMAGEAFLFRIGFADVAVKRSLRREVSDVLCRH